MDFRKTILKTLRGLTFYQTSKNSSVVFYTYDDLLLRTYIDVASSGDFKKLAKSGDATDQQCLEAWESIVRRQEQVTGSNQYNSTLQLMKGYALLINDHTVIRACLIHLMFAPVDWQVLKTLKSKGYKINIDSRQTIIESVKAGLIKNENLITKATMKSKELQKMFQEKEGKRDAKGFEELLALLNASLGFNVDENITLARYNEYQKILKARQKAIEDGRTKRPGFNKR